MKIQRMITLLLAVAITALTGCGGGGGGGGSSATVVSGVVSKGPVTGAIVSVYPILNNQVGATPLATSSATLADGRYSVNIGAYTGPVMVQAVGGDFVNEATGVAGDITGLANGLRAFAANAAGSTTVAVTALTEIAARRIMLEATQDVTHINEHNNGVGLLFGVADIIGTTPVNANSAASATATAAQKDYALALATVAKHIQLQGGTLGSSLTTLASPTTDQVLLDLNAARTAFIQDSRNLTGVTGNTAATTVTLVVNINGALPVGTKIGNVDLTVELPAGVTPALDGVIANQVATTALVIGSDANSGTGSKSILGGYTAATGTAPGKVRIIVVNSAGFGFPTGSTAATVATLTLNKSAGAVVTPAHFFISGLSAGDVPNATALVGLAPSFTATVQ